MGEVTSIAAIIQLLPPRLPVYIATRRHGDVPSSALHGRSRVQRVALSLAFPMPRLASRALEALFARCVAFSPSPRALKAIFARRAAFSPSPRALEALFARRAAFSPSPRALKAIFARRVAFSPSPRALETLFARCKAIPFGPQPRLAYIVTRHHGDVPCRALHGRLRVQRVALAQGVFIVSG